MRALKLKKVLRKGILRTGQMYDTRVFWVPEEDDMERDSEGFEGEVVESLLKTLVITYQAMVEAQVGVRVPVIVFWRDSITVDMSEWPPEEGFGEWFDALMDSFNVKVDD